MLGTIDHEKGSAATIYRYWLEATPRLFSDNAGTRSSPDSSAGRAKLHNFGANLSKRMRPRRYTWKITQMYTVKIGQRVPIVCDSKPIER